MAFLRGVNVGGKGTLAMADLRAALAEAGFAGVRTYINSGNVLFESGETDRQAVARRVKGVLEQGFRLEAEVVVFSLPEWAAVLAAEPKWWGADPAWRHELLILIPPCAPEEVAAAVGQPAAGVEMLATGPGVVYLSILREAYGRSRAARLNRSPLYKRMTVRGPGTARKVLQLLEARAV